MRAARLTCWAFLASALAAGNVLAGEEPAGGKDPFLAENREALARNPKGVSSELNLVGGKTQF